MEKINFNQLFELLKSKGFVYIKLNLINNYYDLECSTGYNGKGDLLEMKLYDDIINDIYFYIGYDDMFKYNNKTFTELIELIKQLPNI